MEKVTGFNNASSREILTFNNRRFTIEIKNGQATSKAILFSPGSDNPCIPPVLTKNEIHCVNLTRTRQFYLNTSNMIFTLTSAWISTIPADSIFLAIGKCESF